MVRHGFAYIWLGFRRGNDEPQVSARPRRGLKLDSTGGQEAMAISLRDGRVKQSISPGKAADKRLRVTEESVL